jgi:diguanylate cyclase (GGDEF)-like protein/PAS domain S-box-containing protein
MGQQAGWDSGTAEFGFFIIVDESGIIRFYCKELALVLGYEPGELDDKHCGIIIPQIQPDEPLEKLQAIRLKGRHKNGTVFPIHLSVSRFTLNDNYYYYLNIRDFVEHKSIDEILDSLDKVIHHSSNQLYIFNKDTYQLVDVNQEACSSLQYTPQAINRLRIYELMENMPRKDFAEILEPIMAGRQESVQLEVNFKRRDGTLYPVKMTLQLVNSLETPRFLAVVHDVQERRKVGESFRSLAYKDYITNLPNRILFQDRLNHSLANAKRHNHMVAVLFLDLDRFKHINESLGHNIGDQLLNAVASRLKACIRENDTISRFGGDEFIFGLVDLVKEENIAKIAQRILNVLSNPFQIEDYEFYLTTSIGISIYPHDGHVGETLVRNAETAMYRVKDQGGDGYHFYDADMNAKVFQRLMLENSLRKAMETDDFVLYYQPQVDSRSGEIIGLEALIRWNHPELGILSPATFIPIAEEIGLIIPIGRWVLQTACKQNKKWQDQGYRKTFVAVNISTRQFRANNLLDVVKEVLEETGLEPQYLKLELTETNAMENAEETIRVLMELRKIGVMVSIDDFGTGYSSLSYLKKLPVDMLKIDRSFITEIMENDDHREIVRAMINLAHTLNMRIVAEGIESQEQWDFLTTLECDVIQGYHISMPLSVRDIEPMLAKRQETHQLL